MRGASALSAGLAELAGVARAQAVSFDEPVTLCSRAARLIDAPEALPPRTLLRRLDGASRRAVIAALRQAIGGRTAQARVRAFTAGGDARHADVRLAREADGAILAAITDRTDDRLLIDSLIEQIDHLWHTVELNPQLPWLAEVGRGITRVTDRYLQMVGLSRDEALGFTGWMKVLHPDDIERMQLAIGQAMLSGERLDMRVRVRAATGDYRWVRTQAFPRRGKDGQIVANVSNQMLVPTAFSSVR